MKRRSLEVEGFVNFPIDKPSTNEGGMFVQLWVFDDKETPFDERYGVCSGCTFLANVNETFVGSNHHSLDTSDFENKDLTEIDITEMEMVEDQYDQKTEDLYGFNYENSTSVPLLTCVTMGSTGWSGDFIAKWSDLNENGKVLWANFRKLYPNASIHLLTFLDT